MFKNVKIKTSLIISYLAVLLLPFLLLIFNVSIFSNSMENKIITSNKISLQSIKAQSDMVFKEINSFNSQITQNPYLYSLVNASSINTDTYLGMVEFQQLLTNHKTLKFPIDLYFIYVINLDIVITSDSTFDGEDFFNTLNVYGDMSYADWKSRLLSASSPYDSYSLKINDTERKMLFYKHPITSGEGSATNAVLVSAVNFNSLIPSSNKMDGGAVVIAKDSVPVFSVPDISELDVDFSQITSAVSDTVNITQGKQKLVVSYVSSDIDDLKYIYIVPYRSFWSETINIMLMSALEIALLIIILGFAVHFFVKKHYSPIEKLLDVAKNFSADTGIEKSDEISYINNALVNISNSNRELSNILYRQNKIMVNNFIAKLLTHQITDMEEISRNAQLYDISFDSSCYAVAVIKIDNVSELFGDSGGDSDMGQDDFTTAAVIISNIMQEIISSEMTALMSIVGKNILTFTVYMDDSSQSSLDKLNNLLLQSVHSIDANFKIGYTVAVGEPCDGPLSLHLSYEDAMQTLEYKFILPSAVILRHDMLEKKLTVSYNFGIAEQQRLMHSINSGIFENTKAVIDDIFSVCFDRSDGALISIVSAKYLLYEIVSCIAGASADMSEKISEYTNGIFNSCADVWEAKKYILKLADEACGKANRLKIESTLKTRAENYVNENYMNMSLSLTEIADNLGVSAKYLSAFYKKHSSFGLQTYINQVRIQNAIRLINDTDMQFKDISSEVGYTNFRTFSRVFKSFTGVTLSQFRSSQS